MSDMRISALTEATALNDTDLLVAVQPAVSGSTKKITLANLITSIAGNDRTFTGGAASATTVLRFGATSSEGLEFRVIDETVSGLSAISTDLTEDVPSGAVILSVQANIETLVVEDVGTGDRIAVGTPADPDKYGETGDFLQNSKIDTIPDWAVLGSAEDIQVHVVADAAGTLSDTAPTAGAVRVRIVYAALNSLDDA